MNQPRDAAVARFNTMINQNVIAVGQDQHVDILRRNLQALQFVQFRVAKTVAEVDKSAHFLVAVVDFANGVAVQMLARFITSIENFAGAKLIFAINPTALSNEDLLFGVELDIRRTFFGVRRDEEIRAYIKQRAVEVSQNGSMAFMENEVRKAIGRHDGDALRLLQEQLSAIDKTSEDANRLLALLFEERRDYKRMVFHLKQTLVANPQNLWAANALGRHYIRNRQAAEGIEILSKLSRYHELNSDRLLALGDAYLNAGRKNEAETSLKKGETLTQGQDKRFTEGLAKVDMMKGDQASALKKLGVKYLNAQILSFLNTRAVMCVRNNAFEEGQKYYKQAIEGCDPSQSVVMSKILFNLGLAYVRSDDLQKAEDALAKSVKLGGDAFNRAAKPLAIARQMAAKRKVDAAAGIAVTGMEVMDEFEWETLSGT